MQNQAVTTTESDIFLIVTRGVRWIRDVRTNEIMGKNPVTRNNRSYLEEIDQYIFQYMTHPRYGSTYCPNNPDITPAIEREIWTSPYITPVFTNEWIILGMFPLTEMFLPKKSWWDEWKKGICSSNTSKEKTNLWKKGKNHQWNNHKTNGD